ncbi:MAG TPA: hypothetical protein VF269_01055 [Rhodanobacteraceae bacterium]
MQKLIGGTAALSCLSLAACATAPPLMPVITLHVAVQGRGTVCTQAQPCALRVAQRQVRQRLASASAPRDIVVQLAGGTYRLHAPLRFGPADSGRLGHAVIWTATPGEHPVLSGSRRVTGWHLDDPAHGIWSAKVPTGWHARRLYVNGKAMPRAQASVRALGLDLRHWNATGFVIHGHTASYFSTLAAHIGPRRVRQLDMIWTPMPPTDWETSSCPVAAIMAGTIRMAQPCWKNLTTRPATIWGAGNNNVNPYVLKTGAAPTSMANALLLLREPGQWYLDSVAGTLYYKPRAGQHMAQLDVELPRLQALLQVTGTLVHPVHDLVFRGLTFSGTTWQQPSTGIGFVQIQANLHITSANNQGECTFTTPAGSCPWGGFAQPPGAVVLTAVRRVQLRDDRFVDLGAVGVEVKYGSDDNLIRGNVFTQIASSAIWLGCAGDPDPLDAKADPASAIIALCATDPASASEDTRLAGSTAEIMTGNTVADNVIHHVGYGYLGAAGITLLFTRHTTIAHNDVFDVPYDGLTSGAWQGHPDNVSIAPTKSDEVTRNINADNAIVDNAFHANMQVFTGDGGNIYTEGHQGRTFRRADGSVNAAASFAHGLRIVGNLFNAAPPGNHAYAIAPDVGSQWIDARGNVEWGLKYAFSCHWPSEAGSRLRATGNWRADPDDTQCPTDHGNFPLPTRPGPDNVPLTVLAHVGVQGRYQALEASLPVRIDNTGVSPAVGGKPARMLITGSGFTRTSCVRISGKASPKVTFVSTNVLVAVVPASVAATAVVSVER